MELLTRTYIPSHHILTRTYIPSHHIFQSYIFSYLDWSWRQWSSWISSLLAKQLVQVAWPFCTSCSLSSENESCEDSSSSWWLTSSTVDVSFSVPLLYQMKWNYPKIVLWHPVQVPWWPSNSAPGIKIKFKDFSGKYKQRGQEEVEAEKACKFSQRTKRSSN